MLLQLLKYNDPVHVFLVELYYEFGRSRPRKCPVCGENPPRDFPSKNKLLGIVLWFGQSEFGDLKPDRIKICKRVCVGPIACFV